MSQFIYEGRGKEQRTGHERIAMTNIRNCINNIVGGMYNDYQDDNLDYLPRSFEEVAETVYLSALNNLYLPGYEGGGRAPKEMRFAGEAFCRAYIDWKLRQDDDLLEIARVVGFEM